MSNFSFRTTIFHITQFFWYDFRLMKYMLRLLTFILLSLISTTLKAQLSADRLTFDFGNIENFNNDTAYFTFTNSGTKTIYLLQTQPKDDYAILCDTKTIGPGEKMRLAVVYYTGKKGRFNLDVPLNFSHLSSPLTLHVKGHIKSITQTAFTTCPSIENTSPLKPSQSPLSIIVRDAETNERIDEAHVTVSKKNISFNCVPGFSQMAYQCKCDYGKINVNAEKTGYLPETVPFEYDAVHNTCFVYLSKKSMNEIRDSLPAPIVQKNDTDTVQEQPYAYIPAIYYDSGFNSFRYKPNHLIFIIDVSKSMRDSTKLQYLKKVMTQLVMAIRPQDHITLITYASKVKVIFENVSGINKNSILTAIDTLSANGGSNGASSIMTAYEIANRHYIEGGNNQLFLATDGLFNSSSITEQDLYKTVKSEYNKHKVIFSSIGFGRDPKALAFLDKLAKNGKGNFLTISALPGDLTLLLEEVKKQSSIQ
jgi:hypothetical protein